MKRGQVIELPKIIDERGNLSFVEARKHIPFSIARVYWIYDIPGGQSRDGHAFKKQHELIIALSGSFDVVLDDGEKKTITHLNRSYKALYVPNMTWRSLENFSTNALCLVLTSGIYDEADYIRDYGDYIYESTTKTKSIDLLSVYGSVVNTSKCNTTVFDCTLIEFPCIKNRAGNITPIHGSTNIPFSIERVFYIYDIPGGATRGMHAHKTCQEILIAASGSFDVELYDGLNKRIVTLNRPKYGLHIPPGIWATQKEYSSGAICVALASKLYDVDDYIYTQDDFIKYRSHDN